ncbi:MAG: M50 family metallopeptidase [Thermaerobacter sp.]|nr:M50 family metallopeptidase [Thermaerobacter sp.]
MTALLFVLLLVVLVVIHEFGHFIVAKWWGVRVDEFSVGFGPRLFGWKRRGTEYSFRLLLLGGYVRLYGMEPGQEETPDSFNSRPMIGRVLTIAAGPVMNFLLAIALFWVLFSAIGVPQYVPGPPGIGGLEQGMPAQRAGLRTGDRLIAANGHALRSWNGLLHVVSSADGHPILFTVQRGSRRFDVSLTPKPDPLTHNVRHIGVLPLVQNVQAPLLTGFVKGVQQTWNGAGMLISVIAGSLAHGKAPPVSGIVGIYGAVQQAESAGIAQVLTLAAVLSVNLGLINLVPFPPLDGERLVMLAIEWIRGRRLDPQREAMVNSIGLMILLGLAVVLAYHDIVRMHGTL